MSGQKISESYEYKTSILTSYDKSEQRIMTRQVPRHVVSYDYDAMNKYQAQMLKNLGRVNQSIACYIPMWFDVTYLRYGEYIKVYKGEDGKPVGGGRVLYIDEKYAYCFRDAEWLLIFKEDTHKQTAGINEVHQIRGFKQVQGALVVTLKTQIRVSINYKNGWIIPMKKCSINPVDNLSFIYSNGAKVTYSFEDLLELSKIQIPESYIQDIEYSHIKNFNKYNLPQIYNEREVFLFTPSWVDDSDMTLNIAKNANKLYNETGVLKYDMKSSESFDSYTWLFYLYEKREIFAMIKFFKRMGGRWKSFWCPTWANDFEILKSISAGDNYLLTEFDNVYKYFSNNTRQKRIVIFTKDGKSYIHLISSWTYEYDASGRKLGKILLQNTINHTIDKSNVAMISFFNLVRFGEDVLNIGYENNVTAEVELSFQEVNA